MHTAARSALAASAVAACLGTAGVASAQTTTEPWIRMINTVPFSAGTLTFGVGGNVDVAPEDIKLTASVSAKTRDKFNLPSTKLSSGTAEKAGESARLELPFKKGVDKKLKKAKSFPVIFKLVVSSDALTETVTKKLTIRKSGGPRLVFGTKNDPGCSECGY